MGRDRCLLRLDESPLYGIHLPVQAPIHLLQQVCESGSFLALDLTARGAPDVETMTAGDDKVVYAHELLHHPPIAPADHAHGAAFGQSADGLPHAFGDERVLWPVHDRRQGAVVVEEDGRTSPRQMPGQLIAVLERVWQVTDVPGHLSSSSQATRLEGRSEERRVGKECRSRWSPY